jgi:pullulanase/glycogen debranching enzyme
MLILACTGLTACGGGGGASAASGGGGGGGGGTSPVTLGTARAVWLDANTIVWPGADATHSYRLFYSSLAMLVPASGGVSGADNAAGDVLTPTTLSAAQLARFPQYGANTLALQVPAATRAQLGPVLRGELAVLQYSGATPTDGTAVQSAPVLDDLFAAAAAAQPLGLTFSALDVPAFHLWAPTASRVRLNVYPTATGGTATTVDMVHDTTSGTWNYSAADAAWTNHAYYTFDVTVWSRHGAGGAGAGGAIVTNTVTDPYSISLSGNSLRSMVLNLHDAVTQPASWPGTLLPTAAAPTDSVLYELHIRDFSINDSSVPAGHRGRYLAFTDSTANGMAHLRALAAAGLTHVHLLPAFDIASVNELGCVQDPGIPASSGAGTAAGLAVKAAQGTDCFNWGYDPLHYGAPEGSYSSNPDDGLARVLEFRQMVAALHAAGLRVVMDVVYNHTSADSQSPQAILDRIVPGYYHRLDANGAVQNFSCCSDTATEHALMARLMNDTLVTWADAYKVDGFRFDVMGMIPKAAMLAALPLVDAVAAADGRGHTYFYGEGWAPAAAVSAVITPATQLDLAGSGIGSFNDRMRDGARGGSPFDSGAALIANQGFINGACVDVNATANQPCGAGGAVALAQDRIRVGLAGSLASFPLRPGVTGAQLDYFGSPTGYAGTPQENIAYVSVHDGETVFDISQYKHPAATTTANVARAQVVGLSLALLAQGMPFIHAGDELLRSKSGDSNSYDSGDYFNRIDWSGTTNYWSVGLPPDNTGNNGANAATLGPILAARPAPSAADIHATDLSFRELLAVRRTTDHFRLKATADVNACVSFPDALAPVAGLIVERIGGDCGGFHSASGYKSVVVLYNATPTAKSYAIPAYASLAKGTGSGNVFLHPVQAGGSDSSLKSAWDFTATAGAGTFTVPARSTGVFVEYR